VIPITILSQQIDTVHRLRWCPSPQPGSGLGEGFSFGTEGLLEYSTVFGFG
jgi:hypothetical protein